ncbi:MAG: flagellar biosynthesis protein FliQ [Pirellulales bacterium]|jgi:flagellar biosynthetic protein FliQ|nr:flagellar biosynthesis protein FliQ [Pirellulales bacterium]
MDSQQAVDMCREAILITLLISAPVLVAGLLVGLVVGLLQALTQIQEQAIAFVPKLLVMVLMLSLTLPWVLGRLLEYTTDVISSVPVNL